MMQKIAIKVCECDGDHSDFPIRNYNFERVGEVALPGICPNSDLGITELSKKYKNLIETSEANENWTLYSVFSGKIARVQNELYLFSFGDIDEVGDCNYFVNGRIQEVVELLLAQWGEPAPDWRGLFKRCAIEGFPLNHDASRLAPWTEFFSDPTQEQLNHLEGLEVGFSIDLKDSDLVSALASL